MAYRCDFFPITKEERDKSHNTLAYATVCRDGILTYYTAGGKEVRELRPASANRQPEFLNKLKDLPIVLEHPPNKIYADPNHPLRVGNIKEVDGYNHNNGNVGTYIKVYDPEINKRIQNGEYTDVSLGYSATIIETPDGVYYDPIDDITYVGNFERVQVNIKPDHLAITKFGRAGADVRIYPHLQKIKTDSMMDDDNDHLEAIRFDSYLAAGVVTLPSNSTGVLNTKKSISYEKTMTTTFRRDSIEFSDVPQAFANWVHERLDAMDEIYRQLGAVQAENEKLQEQIAEIRASEQENAGRADALEEVCEKSVGYLAKHGYKWDASLRNFVRTDSGKLMDEGDEEYEEMDDEEYEEMPMPKRKSGKHGSSRADAVAVALAIEDGLSVRSQAEKILSAYRIDSSNVDLSPTLSPTQVQVNVIAAVRPDTLLYNNSAYVQARFDALLEDADSMMYDATALESRIGMTRRDSVPQEGGMPYIKDAHKKPLKVSTRRTGHAV